MRESVFETLTGLAVLIAAGVFLWFAMARGSEAGAGSGDTYEVGARFNSVSGISRGTDVRLAGVKIGTVRDINLDGERFDAQVIMAISDEYELPDDTTARVQSDGLLGGAYIGLEPGGGFDVIVPCDAGETLFSSESGCGEILYTQGSVDLMTLFASFASGTASSSGEGNSE